MAIDQTFKKHPYLLGGGVIGGGLLLFLLVRKSQGGQSNTANGVGAVAAANAAAQNAAVQSGQVQAQLTATQLAAQVQNNQVMGAVQTQRDQTNAQLIAALAQNQTQAQNAQLSAEVLNNQYNLEAQVTNHTTDAQLAALTSHDQAALDALHSQINGAIQADQLQTQLQTAMLNQVPTIASQFQHLGTGENYNNELIALLGTASGNPGVGVAGINASSGVVINGQNTFSNIMSGIFSLGQRTVAAL